MADAFGDLIDRLAGDKRHFVVVNDDSSGAELDEVLGYFDQFNVSVSDEISDDRLPTDTLLLTDGEQCLGAVDVGTLHEYLYGYAGAGPWVETETDTDTNTETELGAMSLPSDLEASVQGFLTSLDNQVYTVETAGRLPMRRISRHLEQRVLSRGEGTVHAGFQRLSRLRDSHRTWESYVRIAESGVETNVYGVPDWQPPPTDGMRLFADGDGDLVGDVWFVVDDGAGDPAWGGALVAREVEPGRFTGFWTFRPEYVEEVVAFVETTVQPQLTVLSEPLEQRERERERDC